VYQRGADVERQIADALKLSPDRLRERAAVTDQHGPGYLKEECLVYLLRYHQRADDSRLVSDLAEVLLARCAQFIRGHLRSLDAEAASEGYNDVVARLFEQILDLHGNRGDFLQVRFWPALEKLTVRAFQQQLRQQKRAQANVPISRVAGYDADEADTPARVLHPQGDDVLAYPSGEPDVIQSELIHSALTRIEEPYRSAFLLRHYEDWPIEDQDPSVRTISRHFGKDPRTIRNWLKKADAALENWREEQQ
jgi:DNA-directed RNA polymerase specialized sigma24 family protein